MNKESLIVIGGDAAGMSAASRARKLSPDMDITVFEKSSYVSYAACGMPYLISGKVKSYSDLVVYDAKFFAEKRGITVFLNHEVTRISPQQKSVTVKNGKNGEEMERQYDTLLISTGARPLLPPIKGKELGGVFVLRQLENGIEIKDYIRSHSPKSGVILGAGSIGMEMAEAFSEAGIKVTIVEKMPSILGTMDDEITEVVIRTLNEHKVRLINSKAISEFTGESNAVRRAVLEDGERLEADIALIGAGIRANSEIARDAGIELGKTGAIKVNNRMETGISGIYAAGDCAEAYHLVYGRDSYMPLALTANRQGRIAGENIAGGNALFPGITGTAVFKLFDLEVGRTGLTEKDAKNEGIDCIANVIEHFSRAHYYPGADKIRIKLIADRKTGKLLGAQAAGREGVSQRINVFATAIAAKMTAGDVANLDLGYAPPFSPVFDPVLIAADELQKKIE